jgi:hypothetical protein
MPSRHVSDRVGHRHHRQPERQRYAVDADDVGREDRRAATTEDQPERAEGLSSEALRKSVEHRRLLSSISG